MITAWVQTVDDSSAPPDEMCKDVDGFVRRKTWERVSDDGEQLIELTAYVGEDRFNAVVVCWTAWVREYGIRRDYMASGVCVYGGLPRPGSDVERVADNILPTEVRRYALWGDLLFEAKSR